MLTFFSVVLTGLMFAGADEIITFSNDSFEANFYEKSIEQSSFLNELLSRHDKYDVVFITTHLNYNTDFIKKFLSQTGVVIQATEKDLPSDDYGAFLRMMFRVRMPFNDVCAMNCNLIVIFQFYVTFKKLGSKLFNTESSWADEPHLCHNNLDQLANFVNSEILNTVVDQVYNPQEAERAVAHVISEKRIGSTIITFR